MAEVVFVDGQALTPGYFGKTDTTTGAWIPQTYTGTYGTNGFYLNFNNTASVEALGYDSSKSGSELITNGQFVSDVAGWTVGAGVGGTPSITRQAAGTARVSNASNNGVWYYQAITTVIGTTYYAKCTVSNISIGGSTREARLKKSDTTTQSTNNSTIGVITQGTGSGTISGTFVATATTTYIIIEADVLGAGTQGADFDNISVSAIGYRNNWTPTNIGLTSNSVITSLSSGGGAATVTGTGAFVSSTISTTNFTRATVSEWLNVTFSKAITVSKSLKFYFDILPSWGTLSINGVAINSANVTTATVDGMNEWTIDLTATGITTISSFSTPSHAGGTCYVYGVRVDYIPLLSLASSYDAMYDYPQPLSSSGNSYGNYCTLSPLDTQASYTTISDGGLKATGAHASTAWPFASTQVMLSKTYYEVTVGGSQAAYPYIGMMISGKSGLGTTDLWVSGAGGISYCTTSGAIVNNGTAVATYSTSTNGDIINIAYDPATGLVWVGKNGTWFNTGNPGAGTGAVTTIAAANRTSLCPAGEVYTTNSSLTFNFGQRPFAYTIPSGFSTLNTYNLPTPTIKSGDDYFKAYTYTGTGGGLQVGEYQHPVNTYQVARSLRFRSSNSAYLSRTPATAGNQKKFTISLWVKRGAITGARQGLITKADTAGGTYWGLEFDASNRLNIYDAVAHLTAASLTTTAVFKDSSWYHVVVAVDTAQATAADRCKMYVNGVQITSFAVANYHGLNTDTYFNAAATHSIGSWFPVVATTLPFDGYMSEVNVIDGQALTPTSFGAWDANGYWIPQAYTGTYGTNGFYLDFKDSTNIGNDASTGGTNDWTSTNFNVTTNGATYDWMIDSPTLYSDASTTYNRGNYPTFDPNIGTSTISNGGLTVTTPYNSGNAGNTGPGLTTGKWYCEFTYTSSSNTVALAVGIVQTSKASVDVFSNGICYYSGAEKFIDGSRSAFGATYTTGDVISIALDLDNDSISFYKNNVLQGSIPVSSSVGPAPWRFAISNGTSTGAQTVNANFGQRPFLYTPPTGFKAINTYNIAEVTTDLEKPDLVWIKSRGTATKHMLFDTVRGVNKYLSTNATTAEATDVNSLQQFNKNGFQIGSNTDVNTAGTTYVAWAWKANGGTSVTNTSGTITSTVTAGTTPGFSVVSYTGTGVAGATVGHGLGIAPSFIMVKRLAEGTLNWRAYHKEIGNTKIVYPSLTNAATTDSAWNNTTPSSTVITLGNDSAINVNSGATIAYCWAAVDGYSKFGSFTGNGSTDGPFVYCGFRPAFILTKNTTAGRNWLIWDSATNSYNASVNYNIPNTTDLEQTTGGTIDILSNGFKVRNSSSSGNGNGETIVFCAFAENPFKYSNAR
jgi:hypothetical protein